MSRHSNRTERRFIKLLFVPLGGLVLLAGVGYGGFRFYHQWETRRLIRRAESLFNAGDLSAAGLTARRALQVGASKPEGYRVLAKIAEAEGRAGLAVDWREAVVAAAPNSTEDLIALAQTALQFNKIQTAETALAKLGQTANQLPAYHEGLAQVAVAKSDRTTAEQHFAEAVKLDPSNRVYQLNFAVFHLQSDSDEVRASARKTLRDLMEDEKSRAPAARALRDYAAQSRNVPTLVEISSALYGYPEATFRDRLFYVQLLHVLGHPDFAAKLGELQNEAITNSNKLAELLSWMNANGLAVFAIHWAKELPRDVINKRPLAVAVADCYVAAGDWVGLQEWSKKAQWHDLKFASYAYLSKSLREQGNKLGSDAQWNIALHEAGTDGDRIQSLEQSAAKWGWKTEAEELLWTLVNDPQKQNDALAALNQHYFEKRDTGNLCRVAARACNIRPNDDDAQNNLAQLSLLLKINTDRAREVATRIYRKNSKNPIFASTYGFSLYSKGLYQQAVRVMDSLDPADLAKPTIAAYYGIFLASAGDNAKAAEYLKIGDTAPLLPEEKALVQSAQEKIAGQQP